MFLVYSLTAATSCLFTCHPTYVGHAGEKGSVLMPDKYNVTVSDSIIQFSSLT